MNSRGKIMSRGQKNGLIIGGTLYLIVVITITLFISSLTNPFVELKEIFTSAYSNKDVMEHIEDTNGFKVELLENEGRDISSFGALSVDDAVVKKVDDNAITFMVHINSFGSITGDNYEEVVARKKLDFKFNKSKNLKQLKNIGFTNVYIGDDQSEPDFSSSIPSGLKYDNEGI